MSVSSVRSFVRSFSRIVSEAGFLSVKVASAPSIHLSERASERDRRANGQLARTAVGRIAIHPARGDGACMGELHKRGLDSD